MEKWRPVVDVRGRRIRPYEISSTGRVRTFLVPGRSAKSDKARMKAVFPDRLGFLNVTLRVAPGRCNVYLVHQLVAIAFVRGRGKGRVVVHRNHSLKDNRASNLLWVSRAEASRHSMSRRPRRGPAKLTVAAVKKIRASKLTVKQLAKRYRVTVQTIYGILKGFTWRDLRPAAGE